MGIKITAIISYFGTYIFPKTQPQPNGLLSVPTSVMRCSRLATPLYEPGWTSSPIQRYVRVLLLGKQVLNQMADVFVETTPPFAGCFNATQITDMSDWLLILPTMAA